MESTRVIDAVDAEDHPKSPMYALGKLSKGKATWQMDCIRLTMLTCPCTCDLSGADNMSHVTKLLTGL